MRGRMIHHKHKVAKGVKEHELEVRREAQAYDPKGGEVRFGSIGSCPAFMFRLAFRAWY